MCLQKCHVTCFLGRFNAIPWQSQTDVQSSLCRDWSLAIWLFVWMIFSIPKLAGAGSISGVNINVCLLWRLSGVKLHYHFCGCSFGKLCFSDISGRSEGWCENASLRPWCLLRTVCGCWLSLAVYRLCFTEVSTAFLLFFLSFVVFWEWLWANLNLKISLDFGFGASDAWPCYIRVHKDSINAKSHCILAVVFMGEELRLGPVMQPSIMAVSSDRKPEGKSVTSGRIDGGVCYHTHFFGFSVNKNAWT